MSLAALEELREDESTVPDREAGVVGAAVFAMLNLRRPRDREGFISLALAASTAASIRASRHAGGDATVRGTWRDLRDGTPPGRREHADGC